MPLRAGGLWESPHAEQLGSSTVSRPRGYGTVGLKYVWVCVSRRALLDGEPSDDSKLQEAWASYNGSVEKLEALIMGKYSDPERPTSLQVVWVWGQREGRLGVK
eukprot:817871-Pyramimonas_sp.AAC.3